VTVTATTLNTSASKFFIGASRGLMLARIP
jgi:hypothetical protein